jgi:hypothetical protein
MLFLDVVVHGLGRSTCTEFCLDLGGPLLADDRHASLG